MKNFTTDHARMIAPQPGKGRMKVLAAPVKDAEPARRLPGIINVDNARPMTAEEMRLRDRGLLEAERIKAVQARGAAFWGARNDAA